MDFEMLMYMQEEEKDDIMETEGTAQEIEEWPFLMTLSNPT